MTRPFVHEAETEYRWEWKLGPPSYKTIVFNLTVAEMKELAEKVAASAAGHEEWT